MNQTKHLRGILSTLHAAIRPHRLVQIPFLLAALFLLLNHPSLAAERFFFIRDLAQPDRLLSLGQDTAINLLPILLTAVAVLDSAVAANATLSTRARFLIVAIVLLVLIYPLPSAVCLYWLTSNIWSLLTNLRSDNGTGGKRTGEVAVRELDGDRTEQRGS